MEPFTLWWYIAYPPVTLGVSFLLYTLSSMLNGGYIAENVFKSFIKELTWYIPGGLEKRIEYVKKEIFPPGGYDDTEIISLKRGYTAKEVHEQNLYEDVARDSLPGPIRFWTYTIIIPMAAAWPLIACWHIVLSATVLSIFLTYIIHTINTRFTAHRKLHNNTK